MIRTKRAYEPASSEDGKRFLVERLWPRGIKKEALVLDEWPREVAPSTELRKWYGHRVERWPEFQRRYRAELDAKSDEWKRLADAAAQADAVEAGHHDVEKRDVRPVGAERLQTRQPVGHRGDREAVPLQRELGGLTDDVVVLDEQDMGLVCHPAALSSRVVPDRACPRTRPVLVSVAHSTGRTGRATGSPVHRARDRRRFPL